VHASRKYVLGTAIILLTAFFFSPASKASVDSAPNAEDVAQLAEKAKLIADTFMQESFRLRMQYEYSGKFPNESDKEQLGKLAKKAGDELQAVANKQVQLKQQIEDYQGDDWDTRYGVTGLWRKLSDDLYKTILRKYQIDFHVGLASSAAQRNRTLLNIVDEMESLDLPALPEACQLLKARIFTVLGHSDFAYKAMAAKELNALAARSDVRHSTLLRTTIERIKLADQVEPNQLQTIADELAQSNSADDIELVLSFACLARKLNQPEVFQKTVQLWPQTEDFLGQLALLELSAQSEQQELTEQVLQQRSVFEAELATQAAWKDKPRKYKMLVNNLLSMERFQTPLILYVAAAASSESSPAQGVNLLIKASKFQHMQKSDTLTIDAHKIAEQAAQLAYSLVAQDSASCELALQAFENYAEIANEKIDEKLEYLYAIVLNDCGKAARSKALLQKIADRPAGRWRNKAKFELTASVIRQRQYENPEQKSRLLRQFGSLIAENKDCADADEVLELLSEVIDEIERYETKANSFADTVQGYEKAARFCHDCLRQRRSALLLAEVFVLTAGKDEERLSEAEKLLNTVDQDKDVNDVNLLRCRARLLTAQGEFDQAARLWVQAANMRKAESSPAKNRSWKWWRAKYYEIYCWSETPGTEKADVMHTIEVLENSFIDVPPLWAERLNSLKRSQTDE
jgi:hypothetical protein